NGRPKVDSPYVFLRHLAPLEPFSDEDRLHQIIVKYMKLARIPISPQKKMGMHSLRHTLASVLLEKNTPLPVISDILGHVSTDSTAVYLKTDVEKLREWSVNPEEVSGSWLAIFIVVPFKTSSREPSVNNVHWDINTTVAKEYYIDLISFV